MHKDALLAIRAFFYLPNSGDQSMHDDAVAHKGFFLYLSNDGEQLMHEDAMLAIMTFYLTFDSRAINPSVTTGAFSLRFLQQTPDSNQCMRTQLAVRVIIFTFPTVESVEPAMPDAFNDTS